MSWSRTIPLVAVLLLGCPGPAPAKEKAPPDAASHGAMPPQLPQLPTIKPPVEYFRELLAMTASQRRRSLVDRSPESRERILVKLQEYEALPPDDRELRLQATELRWHLGPLLATAPSNRVSVISLIPVEQRALVEARLELWDKLPGEAQRALLENQFTIAYFSDIKGASGPAQERALNAMNPQSRKRLENGLARWHQLPEAERQQLLQRFSQFFDLTPAEKKKALATLSEPEQRQIEKTLKSFYGMSPAQRARCIRGFNEFAAMSPADRRQFLGNAARWNTMTPDQRQAWRDLVAKLSLPPMPYDFAPPPMPPRVRPLPHPAPALTNLASPAKGQAPGS